jgi:hypothetical protein
MPYQEELHRRLRYLEEQKSRLEREIRTIKLELNKHSAFSKAEKVALFRELFIGNEQAYAKYWISSDGLRKGYAPVTRTFRGKDYVPISDSVLQQHLEGKIRLGTYAIKNYTMCSFLAIDLDKSSYVADARAINTVCREVGISPYFELSKSGNGLHLWFFFEEDVRARDTRILGDLLITKAMDISEEIDMQSYDRLFPSQDYVAPDALGNLIAVPLHYTSRCEGKTVFVDINTVDTFG